MASQLVIAFLGGTGLLDARNRGLDPFRFGSVPGIPGREFRNGYESDVQNADYDGSSYYRQERSGDFIVHGVASLNNGATTSPWTAFVPFCRLKCPTFLPIFSRFVSPMLG
jgi:hypothetical protein